MNWQTTGHLLVVAEIVHGGGRMPCVSATTARGSWNGPLKARRTSHCRRQPALSQTPTSTPGARTNDPMVTRAHHETWLKWLPGWRKSRCHEKYSGQMPGLPRKAHKVLRSRRAMSHPSYCRATVKSWINHLVLDEAGFLKSRYLIGELQGIDVVAHMGRRGRLEMMSSCWCCDGGNWSRWLCLLRADMHAWGAEHQLIWGWRLFKALIWAGDSS